MISPKLHRICTLMAAVAIAGLVSSCGRQATAVSAEGAAERPSSTAGIAAPCTPKRAEPGPGTKSPAEAMKLLEDDDTMVGVARDDGSLAGYRRLGDEKPTDEEIRLGGFKSPFMPVVDACGKRIGGAARQGAFFFTDEEINAPGFEVNKALAERAAAHGATYDQGPPPTLNPR